MIEVPLTQGQIATVDASDADAVNQFKWSAVRRPGTYYARRTVNGKHEYLHQFLMKPSEGLVVDHIDGDGLNNSRANLRVCSQAENMRNSRLRAHNKSGYRGVCWDVSRNRWRAYINSERRSHYLGMFSCPIEAAIARDVAALELHGEYAALNFPKNHYQRM